MPRDPRIWMNRLGYGGSNRLVHTHFSHHLSSDPRETVALFDLYKAGALTDPKDLPPSGVLEHPKRKSLPDAFYIGPFVVVSARAKSVLEAHDLGGGWFSPFTVFRRKGEPFEGEFFILNVAAKKTAVIMREPEMRPGPPHKPSSGTVNRAANWDNKVPIRPAALEGADLWQDTQLYPGDIFFYSDQLYLACKRAKLTGFIFYRTIIEGDCAAYGW